MASQDWIEIYRSYTPEELVAEIIELKRQKTLFSSQSMGNKSATKDLVQLQQQLHAAIRVQNENGSPAPGGGRNNPFDAVMNFRNIRV